MPSDTPKPPRGFRRAFRRAERVAREDNRTQAVLAQAFRKLQTHRDSLGVLRHDLPVLLRLVRAYVRKEYRAVPWRTLVGALAALLYFVNPLDVVPDLLPFVGLVDDAAILAYVLRAFQRDLTAFQSWETTRSSAVDGSFPPAPDGGTV